MSIIDRLLFREVFKTLAVILFVLVIVMLTSQLVKMLGKAADGSINPNVLATLVGLQTIKVIGVLLPPAFFFSLLWVLGAMYRDSEMISLFAGGIGIVRVYKSIFLICLPVLVIASVLMLQARPWAYGYIDQIKQQQRDSTDISGVRAGHFNEFQRGGLVIYSEGGENPEAPLSKVFVQDRQQGKLGIVFSGEASQSIDKITGERFIILKNGMRYVGSPGNVDYTIVKFREYGIRMPSIDLGSLTLPISAQPSLLLWMSDDLRSAAEIQSRIATILSIFIFATLAVPLAKSQPRKDIFGRIMAALLIYFIFLNMQRVAERWFETGTSPEWIGLWWVSFLMLGIAGFINLYDSNWLAARLRSYRIREFPK